VPQAKGSVMKNLIFRIGDPVWLTCLPEEGFLLGSMTPQMAKATSRALHAMSRGVLQHRKDGGEGSEGVVTKTWVDGWVEVDFEDLSFPVDVPQECLENRVKSPPES
jgi:hypothetical protein